MKLVLLGAPGAGKGTQAEILSEKLGIPTISTGNMLRAAIAEGTTLGQQVKSLMDAGKLISDEIVIQLVKERIAKEDCANGFILDGMPRTIPQAEALQENGILLDAAVSLEVKDEEIIQRMSGRRVCTKCGATYHIVSNPPAKEGICDNCGDTLVIRKDDAPETVKDRLDTYHTETEPLKAFYEKLGLLRTVESIGGIQKVSEAVLSALGIAE